MSADEYLQRTDFAEEPQLVTGEDANSVDDLILERSEEYRIVPDAAPGWSNGKGYREIKQTPSLVRS